MNTEYIKLQKNSKRPAGFTWTKCKEDYDGNRGRLCGKDITVIDLDIENQYEDYRTDRWLKSKKLYNILFGTKTVSTTSKHTHHYYKWVDLPNRNLRKYGLKLEIKNIGSYVVAEGSVVNGKEYEPYNDEEIKEMPPEMYKAFHSLLHSEEMCKVVPTNHTRIKGEDKIRKMFNVVKKYDKEKVVRFLINCECCPNGHKHKSNNTYAIYHKKKKDWYLQCFDDDCIHIKQPIEIIEEHKEFCDLYFNSLKKYDKCKRYFEKYHMKIKKPIVYMRKYLNYEDIGDFDLMDKKTAVATYDHLSFEAEKDGKIRKRPFIRDWINDGEIKLRKGITFSPLETKMGWFNLFQQFEYQRIQDAEQVYLNENYLQDVKDLVMDLVGGDEIGFEKVMIFIADILQRPNQKKFGKCLIFTGDQGTGKTCFWEWVGEKIIGQSYFYSSSNTKDFVGDFACGVFQKLLCMVEEMSGKDGFECAEKIKDTITGTHIRYEQKFKDSVKVKNLARFVMPTNNLVPAKVERGDRRFEPFETSSKNKGNEKYWTHMNEVVFKDKATILAFVDYLMHLPVKSYIWKEHDNKIKKEMMISTLSPTERYMIEFCRPRFDDGKCYLGDSDEEEEKEEKNRAYGIREIHSGYLSYVETNGGNKYSPIMLAKHLRRIGDKFKGLSYHLAKNRDYVYSIQKEILFEELSP